MTIRTRLGASARGTPRVPPGGGSGSQGAQGAQGAQGSGGQGAQGAQGFQGAQGDGLIIAGAPQIGYVVGWDGAQKVWEPVPTVFAINSFTSATPALVLAGTTLTNPPFSASYNQSATAVTLTDSLGHSDPIALPGTAFVSPHTFLIAAYGTVVTFTDTASSPLGSAARSVSVTGAQPVKWGAVVDPGVYDSAFITSLGSSSLQLGPSGTFAVNATVGQSVFYATRTAFGVTALNLKVNGLPFAVSKVGSAVPFTNANGVTENYDVWRSDNTGLGSFSFTES